MLNRWHGVSSGSEGWLINIAEIAESLLSMALCEGTSSDRIDVVFDDYREYSIKSAERENRGEGSRSKFRNLQADRQVKQWRKFLCSSRNKQALIVFVTKKWQKEKYADKLSGKTLVVTCGREAYQLSCCHVMLLSG